MARDPDAGYCNHVHLAVQQRSGSARVARASPDMLRETHALMSNAEDPSTEAIRSWIERQRELLRGAGGGRAASESAGAPSSSGVQDLAGEAQDLATRWLAGAQTYLHGLSRFTAASAEPRPPEAGLGAQTAAAQEASRTFFELLATAPSLGLAREHTQAWRDLLAAQQECQELQQALMVELTRVQNEALALLEREVRDKQIADWRELYDMWVECGEQAWLQIAGGEAYCKLQGEFANATVRLRAAQQRIAECALRQLDLPTRSEVSTMQRQIRELRERVAELEARRRQT